MPQIVSQPTTLFFTAMPTRPEERLTARDSELMSAPMSATKLYLGHLRLQSRGEAKQINQLLA